jgi:hypothetical protein
VCDATALPVPAISAVKKEVPEPKKESMWLLPKLNDQFSPAVASSPATANLKSPPPPPLPGVSISENDIF